jgi:hypothetical protein
MCMCMCMCMCMYARMLTVNSATIAVEVIRYVRVYLCMYECMRVCVYVCVCICIHEGLPLSERPWPSMFLSAEQKQHDVSMCLCVMCARVCVIWVLCGCLHIHTNIYVFLSAEQNQHNVSLGLYVMCACVCDMGAYTQIMDNLLSLKHDKIIPAGDALTLSAMTSVSSAMLTYQDSIKLLCVGTVAHTYNTSELTAWYVYTLHTCTHTHTYNTRELTTRYTCIYAYMHTYTHIQHKGTYRAVYMHFAYIHTYTQGNLPRGTALQTTGQLTCCPRQWPGCGIVYTSSETIMCVRVYMLMHVCVCVYTHAHTHIQTHTHTHKDACVHTYIYIPV